MGAANAPELGARICPKGLDKFRLEEPMNAFEEDTAQHAIADLLILYLDHLSYPVAQGAVRACTSAFLSGSKAVPTALQGALNATEQMVERGLMVLDAASLELPTVVGSFAHTLARLRTSPNFAIRSIASVVQARIVGDSPMPPIVACDLPAIYTFHLPNIALHRTERASNGGPVVVHDPARMLRPLDIQARIIAENTGLAEDNVLYRAAQYLNEFEKERTWLAGRGALDGRRLVAFLDAVGLRHAHNKPHIAPARRALAHVIAELYDSGRLPPESYRWLSGLLIRHDPAFILRRPDRRPVYMAPMGGRTGNDQSFFRFPDGWVDAVEDSMSLLHPRSPDGRIIVGEWTRLRYLDEKWPEEERLSVVRPVSVSRVWDELDIERGHPPFARILRMQVADYLLSTASLTHLVIAHDPHDWETPAEHWLALNPAVGKALGWHPIRGGWFRWADGRGVPVAESIWWSESHLDQFNQHLHEEVGEGWLVLITEPGVQEIAERAGSLTRGGIVRRRKGWYGNEGQGEAIKVLSL